MTGPNPISQSSTTGYVIALRPALAAAQHEAGPFASENRQPLADLRQAFDFLQPDRYRGMGRWQLQSWPSLDERVVQQFHDSGLDMDTDGRARRRYEELLEEYEVAARRLKDERCEDWLLTVEDSREVLGLLERPGHWEVLRLSLATEAGGPFLGYDVGWVADYSLICDTVVMPTWHPPAEADYPEMAKWMRCLSEHVLFPNPEVAAGFIAWYSTRDWGEGYGYENKFRIVQIAEPADG